MHHTPHRPGRSSVLLVLVALLSMTGCVAHRTDAVVEGEDPGLRPYLGPDERDLSIENPWREHAGLVIDESWAEGPGGQTHRLAFGREERLPPLLLVNLVGEGEPPRPARFRTGRWVLHLMLDASGERRVESVPIRIEREWKLWLVPPLNGK